MEIRAEPITEEQTNRGIDVEELAQKVAVRVVEMLKIPEEEKAERTEEPIEEESKEEVAEEETEEQTEEENTEEETEERAFDYSAYEARIAGLK